MMRSYDIFAAVEQIVDIPVIWNNMTLMWRHCYMVACRNIVTLANPFISVHFCYIWWLTDHIFCYLFISCIKIWPIFLWRRGTLVLTHPINTLIICLNRPCMCVFTSVFPSLWFSSCILLFSIFIKAFASSLQNIMCMLDRCHRGFAR